MVCIAAFIAFAPGASNETILHSHLTSIAVFKPGLVYAVREVDVPAGLGSYRLDRVPRALDGTLWTDSPDGAAVSELRTTINLQTSTSQRDAKSISELIQLNVGHIVSLRAKEDAATINLSGKIFSVDGPKFLLQQPSGSLRSVDQSSVVEIDLQGLETKMSNRLPSPELHFRVDAKRPSRVRFTSLETGAAWVANYRLDLNKDQAQIESAAQLGLGALACDGTIVRLVSGMPMLRDMRRLDLSAGGNSLESFLANEGPKLNPIDRDPFAIAEAMLETVRPRVLPGGQGLVDNGIDFISYDPTDNSIVVRDDTQPQFLAAAVTAARVEDLHVYEFGTVTLEPGGRIRRILSTSSVPTHSLYRWVATDGVQIDHLLRVKNTTAGGWPTGMALITRDGLPTAQIEMPFTAPGQDANLVIGSAEDLVKSVETTEISRKPLERVAGRPQVQLTCSAVLRITNPREEAIDVEAIYRVIGTIALDGGGEVTKRLSGSELNPASSVTFRRTLAPGATAEWKLTFTTDQLTN